MAHECQPEPRASAFPTPGSVDAIEALEDAWEVLRAYARARVGDLYVHGVATCQDPDRHAPLLRVGDGVVEQVVQSDGHVRRFGGHEHVDSANLAQIDVEREPTATGGSAVPGDRAVDCDANIRHRVEQVAYKPLQTTSFSFDLARELQRLFDVAVDGRGLGGLAE